MRSNTAFPAARLSGKAFAQNEETFREGLNSLARQRQPRKVMSIFLFLNNFIDN